MPVCEYKASDQQLTAGTYRRNMNAAFRCPSYLQSTTRGKEVMDGLRSGGIYRPAARNVWKQRAVVARDDCTRLVAQAVGGRTK